MKQAKNKESGQILMIVLIIVLVATLSGLMLYTKSLNESSSVISQEEKDKTFNAAEEKLSKYMANPNLDAETGVIVSDNFSEGSVSFTLAKNAVLGIESGGTINIFWTDCQALLVENWSEGILQKYDVYKPSDCTITTGIDVIGSSLVSETMLNVSDGGYSLSYSSTMIRVKALTGEVNLTLSGDITDFYQITAEAEGDDDSSIVQNLQGDRSGDFLPEIFDYVLYSGGSINKDE